MNREDITVLYSTPDEFCFELNGTPVLVRGEEIEWVEVDGITIRPGDEAA